MLRFHAHKFVGVLNTLARLDLAADKDWTFQPDTRRYLGDQISQIATQLEEMRLPVSLKKAREIEFIFKGAVIMEGQRESIFGILKTASQELRGRIEAEIESKLLFCMSDAYANYWPTPEIPIVVPAVFANSAYDIESAAKCLSLEQGTACVLHLMRAIEAIVKNMAAHLKIEKVDKEWGKLLSDLHSKIEAMSKGDQRDEWSAAHANLYHVKQAWRNKSMHPLDKYTPEEAAEIFEASMTFLRHLATLV
jgi:hypothetical protein